MNVSLHVFSCAWALCGYCESWLELCAVTLRFCYDLVDASSLSWLILGVYISVGPRVLCAAACFLNEIAVSLVYDPIVYAFVTATRWVIWGARVIKKDVVSFPWHIQSAWYRCTRICRPSVVRLRYGGVGEFPVVTRRVVDLDAYTIGMAVDDMVEFHALATRMQRGCIWTAEHLGEHHHGKVLSSQVSSFGDFGRDQVFPGLQSDDEIVLTTQYFCDGGEVSSDDGTSDSVRGCYCCVGSLWDVFMCVSHGIDCICLRCDSFTG